MGKVQENMNDDQIEGLKKELKDFLLSIIEEQHKITRESLETIQTSVNRIDEDLASDRKDIGNLRTEMIAIRSQFNEIIDQFSKQTSVIVNKVHDKITEGVNNVADAMVETVEPMVKDTLDNFVATNPKIEKKKGCFSRLFKK